jgi:hypothetical protein
MWNISKHKVLDIYTHNRRWCSFWAETPFPSVFGTIKTSSIRKSSPNFSEGMFVSFLCLYQWIFFWFCQQVERVKMVQIIFGRCHQIRNQHLRYFLKLLPHIRINISSCFNCILNSTVYI